MLVYLGKTYKKIIYLFNNYKNMYDVNLEELYLSNNQITRIENLENLVNLKRFYLYNNQITKITKSCYDFLKLKNVIIYGCDIDKLEIVEEN